MIPADFSALCAVELVIADPATGVVTGNLPLPVYMEEIDAGISVLNEIERQHGQDVERNITRYMPSADRATWKRGWAERVKRVMPRELYRTVAYLMYLLTLEGAVRTAYEDLQEKLNRCSEDSSERLASSHNPRLSAIRETLAPVVLVRNKVFAHTAFAKPRRDDTMSMQFSSLQYLVGNAHGWGHDGLVFGGNWRLGGEPSPGLPAVGVSGLAALAREVFREWRSLLGEGIAALAALSDEDIVRAMEGAVRVVRLGERKDR